MRLWQGDIPHRYIARSPIRGMVFAPKLYLHLGEGCRTSRDNIVYRFACRNNDRLPEFATELACHQVNCHHHVKQPPGDIRRKSGGCESTPFASHATLHRAREGRSRSVTFGIATFDRHRAGSGDDPCHRERISSDSVADAHCQNTPSEMAREDRASARTTTTKVPMLWRPSC